MLCPKRRMALDDKGGMMQLCRFRSRISATVAQLGGKVQAGLGSEVESVEWGGVM